MSGYGWVQEELERLADPGYRTFHEGLIPGVKMSYGVRLPQLRGLAKTILKGGALDYLRAPPPTPMRKRCSGAW